MTTKLKLGKTITTPGAADSLHPEDVLAALCRHANGDWGELDTDDQRVNDEQLQQCVGILSLYSDRRGVRFYIITDADRSLTTVLLPDEY